MEKKKEKKKKEITKHKPKVRVCYQLQYWLQLTYIIDQYREEEEEEEDL